MDDLVSSSQQQQLQLQNHFFDQTADSVRNRLYVELWKACADPLMCIPICGERVCYFPRVHIDQLDNSTNLEVIDHVQISNLPPKVLCHVINVQLLANQETDEAYAQITLLPDVDQAEAETAYICPPEPLRPQFHSFHKVLSASDTNCNWGLVVPWRDAVNCFPPLDTTQEQPSQELKARDIHGIEWRFRHVFKGHPPRHLLTKGWKAFVKVKRLVAGDSVVFTRGENGELLVGVRRRFSRTFSQHKYQVGAVISHALLTRNLFTIRCEARTKSIISLSKYLQSVNGGSKPSMYYVGEGYQHRSEGSDEQMEELDETVYSLPQPTTIPSEFNLEELDDILCIPPVEDLPELDNRGDFEGSGDQMKELDETVYSLPTTMPTEFDWKELYDMLCDSPAQDLTGANGGEEREEQSHISSYIPNQIQYGGPGRGDEKILWEGYLVAQWCIPTLNRVISRYPNSLLGIRARSNTFKSMCLETLAEVVYWFEHITVESLGNTRDEFNMAKQLLWDLKLSGIDVSWVETRLEQIDEALRMQSFIQLKKELELKYEEVRSEIGKVEEELGSVNKQLEESSSRVGPNHPATDKPILDGLL